MSETPLQKKVRHYETWYDLHRAHIVKNIFGRNPAAKMDFKKYNRISEPLNRSSIIENTAKHYLALFDYDADERFQDNDYNRNKMRWLMETAPSTHKESIIHYEKINNLLPYPLPNKGSLIDSVYSIINEYREPLAEILQQRKIIRGEISYENNYIAGILDFLDGAIAHLYVQMFTRPEVELMLLDADLAQKVIASNNTPISGEDLEYLPFDFFFIEFSEPIVFASLNDKTTKAYGVGFYKNSSLGCYTALWACGYVDIEFEATCSFMFAPPDIWRFFIGNKTRRELNMNVINSSYGVLIDDDSATSQERIDEFYQQFDDLEKQVSVATRNIWDFVTCRNIDYEFHKRDNRDLPKKPKHQQGANDEAPRHYRILKVNKVIYEKDKNASESASLTHSIHIPGAFHKWVYCKKCEAVHRHDLIGLNCRKCDTIVGPTSNIVLKKWWHSDYWIGEGPIKTVVREVRE